MANNLDFEAWRCMRDDSKFCPPEGCPKDYGCARDKGWMPGQPTPEGCLPRQVRTEMVNIPILLAGVIARCAKLSDTPEKWEVTLAALRRHGVDTAGYETFPQGRDATIAATKA